MYNTCHATGLFWTHEQIQEQHQRLRYVIPHVVKDNYEASSQYYSGVQHDQEVMPKKSEVVWFKSLPDTMCSIRHNKETFSVDVVEHINAVKNNWGLLFYGVNGLL